MSILFFAVPMMTAGLGASGCGELASDSTSDPALAEAESEALPLAQVFTPDAITFSGAGCSSGTWTSNGATSLPNLVFKLRAFESALNPPSTLASSACHLVIPLPATPGRGSALQYVKIAGEGAIPSGTDASVSVTISASGLARTYTQDVKINGNFYGKWEKQIAVPEEQLAFGFCGRSANLRISVNVRVRNTSGNGIGALTVNEIGRFGIASPRCGS